MHNTEMTELKGRNETKKISILANDCNLVAGIDRTDQHLVSCPKIEK